jgi:hypothetical protein
MSNARRRMKMKLHTKSQPCAKEARQRLYTNQKPQTRQDTDFARDTTSIRVQNPSLSPLLPLLSTCRRITSPTGDGMQVDPSTQLEGIGGREEQPGIADDDMVASPLFDHITQ